jgi:hypothetical protein
VRGITIAPHFLLLYAFCYSLSQIGDGGVSASEDGDRPTERQNAPAAMVATGAFLV